MVHPWGLTPQAAKGVSPALSNVIQRRSMNAYLGPRATLGLAMVYRSRECRFVCAQWRRFGRFARLVRGPVAFSERFEGDACAALLEGATLSGGIRYRARECRSVVR